MSSYFMHELLHSEFSRWIVERIYPAPLSNAHFFYSHPTWNAIVKEKFGDDAPVNHHALMSYFVDRIAFDLWTINNELNTSALDGYKYFVYDLLHTDYGLVAEGFLTQQQLDTLKVLNAQVSSTTQCDD
jgi:hypothetical protein